MRDPADVDEAVFDVVEQVPPGRVTTYGAIGGLLGIGPRRVARALSSGGGAVPWWRVLRADGTVAEPVRVRQLELLAAEGVPVRNGRVDLAAVGWPDLERTPLPPTTRKLAAGPCSGADYRTPRCVPI